MQLKNYMEDLVFDMMKEVIKDGQVCGCDKCMLDIAAISLNSLPPRYIVTEQGELYSKTDMLKLQFEIDVITAISMALEKVKNSPRHSRI